MLYYCRRRELAGAQSKSQDILLRGTCENSSMQPLIGLLTHFVKRVRMSEPDGSKPRTLEESMVLGVVSSTAGAVRTVS